MTWRRGSPLSARATLWLIHHAPPVPPPLLRSRLGRRVLLRRIYGRPERVPPGEALEAAAVMRSTRGFDEHLRETAHSRFTGGQGIEVPVTIATASESGWYQNEPAAAMSFRRTPGGSRSPGADTSHLG
jgi:hypothetical protein